MSAGRVVFARLDGNTSAENRVYPLRLPQDPTYPAVTYQQISSVRTHAMGQDGPVHRIRLQVNAWGSTYAEARTLAGEVEGQLSRFRGQAGELDVLDILLDLELETYEEEANTRRVMQDFTILLVKNP